MAEPELHSKHAAPFFNLALVFVVVFFSNLTKGLCFVTHRILRSKCNIYYMRTAAGYFPHHPGLFVYKRRKIGKWLTCCLVYQIRDFFFLTI